MTSHWGCDGMDRGGSRPSTIGMCPIASKLSAKAGPSSGNRSLRNVLALMHSLRMLSEVVQTGEESTARAAIGAFPSVLTVDVVSAIARTIFARESARRTECVVQDARSA